MCACNSNWGVRSGRWGGTHWQERCPEALMEEGKGNVSGTQERAGPIISKGQMTHSVV